MVFFTSPLLAVLFTVGVVLHFVEKIPIIFHRLILRSVALTSVYLLFLLWVQIDRHPPSCWFGIHSQNLKSHVWYIKNESLHQCWSSAFAVDSNQCIQSRISWGRINQDLDLFWSNTCRTFRYRRQAEPIKVSASVAVAFILEARSWSFSNPHQDSDR